MTIKAGHSSEMETLNEIKSNPSGHMTFIQRGLNVDATS